MKNLMALMAVSLTFELGAVTRGDTSWMKDSVGIGAHWTAQCVYEDGTAPASFEDMVNGFDVDLFVGQLADAGVNHVIFTIAHEYQMLPCPNDALDAIEPGRTSKRDLLGEIIAKLKAHGIRFVAYYNHSCNNFNSPINAKWFNAVQAPYFGVEGGSMEKFAENYCAIVADISRRYGDGISAWWFDSAPSIDSTGTLNFTGTEKGASVFPFDRLVEAAKSGNPDAAVSINPGIADYHLYTENVDFYSGESVWFGEDFMGERKPGIADSRWICADSLGWVFTADAFANGGFILPRLNANGYAEYIRLNQAADRMVTFNILIDARGKFNPMALAGVKAGIAKARKGAEDPIGNDFFGRMDVSKFNIGTYCLAPYARTERHIKDIADCGIDFVVSAPYDRGVLDLFAKYNIGAVVSEYVPGWWGGDGANAGKMHEDHTIEAYAKCGRDFVDHPAIWGIDIGDEPSAKDFPHYGNVVDWMLKAFPTAFPYLNLYPNYASVAENTADETVNQLGTATYAEHIAEYVKNVPLPYICYDFYVYGCRDHERMFENFDIVSRTARESGKRFWYVAQVNSMYEGESMSLEQLKYQAYIAMAYGAETILWACWTKGWWYDNVLDLEGNRTAQYDKLKAMNSILRKLGETYMKYKVTDTRREYRDGVLYVIGDMVSRDGDGTRALFTVRAAEPCTASITVL